MNTNLAKKTIVRFLEILISCTVLSAIVTLLNVITILVTKGSVLFALCVAIAIFMFLNYRFSKNSFFRIRNMTKYYVVNAIAYLAFVIVTAMAYIFCGEYVFTWLFAIVKFAYYTQWSIPPMISGLFFHFLLFFVILIAPLGMGHVIMYYEEKD